VNLLCRLLEPSSGTIRVDGLPLADYRVDEWLAGISIAGQDIDLIDGTIAENIAYSLTTIDRERIEKAARLAKADFIEDLPLGLDAFVGPRGLNLSGGQRQRIGLARALAREPQILILDEATNAIDYETENAIIRTLQELKKSMTILVISHRPSTLAFCDDAVVLSSGRVLETGPLGSTPGYHAMRSGGGDMNVTYAAAADEN
jgi:subfamily B ATP-binding cassette protein MsbA